MLKRSKLLCLAVALGATFASTARAATSGTYTVTLVASANAMIQILDAEITMTPTATDYGNDYCEAAGAAGIHVRVKTNSMTGMVLMVRCADASPQITLADLMVRTLTAAGTGGTTMGSYTAITAANQNLWTTSIAQHPWQTVATDVRVQNLMNYDDAITAGTSNFTNTLTYTVVAQ